MRIKGELRLKGDISRFKPRRPHPPGRRIGLARALSKLGYCSRSNATKLIHAGRVHLNGMARRDPEAPVAMGRDRIEVDGRVIGATARGYWMMNKPRGVVTTASDEMSRETVYSCLPENLPWLAPVGRLDKASEGLLLLTNDSEWAAQVTAPESHIQKTYHVQIDSVSDSSIIDKLRAGVRLQSGEILGTKRAQTLRQGQKNSWLVVVLDEGKNRQIRRMFEALGIKVLRLVRVAIGSLQLGDLPKGRCRELTREERHTLASRLA